MKLHRLEFQGIGPFAGRHVIDVDALGGDGLFLLEGPTGSGKSTVIDALTFALYGSTAAEASGETRIRSTQVGPEVETFVDLVVTVARGTYRVRRTPAYQRRKMRGTGTTEEKATATLWSLTPQDLELLISTGVVPQCTHLASGAREVSIEMAGIVGLTKEQFAQTVVLPQGEFARFLRSSSEEREKILQKIFATHLYQDLEDALVARASQHRKELESAAASLRANAERYAGLLPETTEPAAAETAEPGPAEPSPREQLDAALALVIRGEDAGSQQIANLVQQVDAGAEAALTEQATARDATAQRAERAREQLDAQRALADSLRRRTELLARRHALEESAQAAAEDAERLHAAERAARVTPSLTALDEARADLTAASTAVRAAPATVPGGASPQELARLAGRAVAALGPDTAEEGSVDLETPRQHAPSAALPDIPELRATAPLARSHADAITATRGGLSDALALEAGLPERRAALEAEAARITELSEAVQRRREDLEALPVLREQLTARLAQARAQAESQPAAATAHQQATSHLAAARKAEAAAAVVTAAEASVREASETAVRAVEAEADLRRRRIEGIAGELAAELSAGTPCPVCGAPDHPEPAQPGPDQPTPEQIERAEEARQEAEVAQSEARSALATARTNLAHWEEASGGLDVPAAETAVEHARAALDAARSAAATAEAAEAQRDEFDTATSALQQRAEADATALAHARTRQAATEEAVERDAAAVSAARGDAPSVAHRVVALDAEAATARTLAERLERCLVASQAVSERSAQLDRVLAEEEFPDAAAVRTAALPTGERTRLSEAARRRAVEEQSVTEALAAPAIAALTGAETTDVPTAQAQAEEARAAADAAAQEFGRAEAIAKATARDGAMLLAEARAHVTAGAHAAPYVRLAALARGQEASLRRIPLTTFVLMRRFEDVLAAANTRLLSISSGRYELARVDKEGGARERKIGLGLEVIDHETETSRSPNTLSGGETFYVSLSLALGLADVVRAEAGGVELGTLLIDEGFGSLDQHTLDVVMAELLRLRDAGRTVGLVSHVTEMQRMIQDKIEVRRIPGRGSTLAVNWMEG